MICDYSNILCEGDKNSLDYQVYSIVFADKNVLPCGAKSLLMVKEEKLKNKESVCAIIDRDILSKKEIETLKNDDIYTLKVRAIENLFVTDFAIYEICDNKNIERYEASIKEIKRILFNKYGKRLNKQYEIVINEENILEFYDPKKVINTVALMLNMSQNEYIKVFFDLLKKKSSYRKSIEQLIEQ